MLRAAVAADQASIRSLIYEGRINPFGLHWPNFVVATDENSDVIGVGQLKPHRGGLVELASIAVRPAYRGQRVAERLITHLLAQAPRPVWLMCAQRLTPFYARFGFVEVVSPSHMPTYYRRIKRVSLLVSYFSASGLAIMVKRE